MSCRSCNAPVIWATNEKTGGRMPFDAEPDPKGKWELVDGPDGKIARYDKGGYTGLPGVPGSERYTSHFTTCPDAKAWRGRRRQE